MPEEPQSPTTDAIKPEDFFYSVDKILPPGVGSFFGQTPEGRAEDLRRQAETAALYAPYHAVMRDYYEKGEDKWKSWEGAPPFGEYKCHLNVTPENVLTVSDFLKTRGYHHKYLHGGEVESGKIFTVYVGGKDQAEQIIREIEDGVGSFLGEPNSGTLTYEARYAPHVCGRFTTKLDGFVGYFAQNGIPIHQDKRKSLFDVGKRTTVYEPDALDDARKRLTEKYGEYFGGGLAYYDPSQIDPMRYFKK